MGCGASSGQPFKTRETITIKTFPLSIYQKELLKQTWKELQNNIVTLGNGIFYRLFKERPDLVTIFPTFGNVQDFEKIKNHPVLLGHPKNITYTFRAAIMLLDDTDAFITELETLGGKHEYELKTEHLNALGTAIMDQIEEILGNSCTLDVKNAWTDFYATIVKLMKQGFAKGAKT
eukprot:Seg1715.3 transcript_id=Seg1715.3/GoldUCD/mRNA.D3Y31 product=Neuroglobin protein_id=Seg1715.3/GoldUCD/D3Y31